MKPLLLWSSFPSQESAEICARKLVEQKLVACAQVGSAIKSFYRWKGQLESSDEIMLWAKFSGKAEPVIAAVKASHPYDIPEILVSPVETGYPPYIDWIRDSSAS